MTHQTSGRSQVVEWVTSLTTPCTNLEDGLRCKQQGGHQSHTGGVRRIRCGELGRNSRWARIHAAPARPWEDRAQEARENCSASLAHLRVSQAARDRGLWRAIILITYITHTKHVWVPHGIIPRGNIPARGCAVGLTAGGGGYQIGRSALPRRDMAHTTQCVHRRTESELWVLRSHGGRLA